MRVKLILSYDGSRFYGFQRQNNENEHFQTVTGVLEKSLKALGIHAPTVGSGRTDRGVHALRQVVHLDLPPFWEKEYEKLRSLLNRSLMPHLHIQQIHPTLPNFHARFSAQKRLYRYFLYDGVYQPFYAHYALHVNALDVQRLHHVAQSFQGAHNFEFFKKQGGGLTRDERILYKVGAYRYKHLIVIYFLGDAFLRSQIRMMCNALLKVCYNEIREEELIAQLRREKKVSTTLLPPSGLYLSRIFYET